MSVELDSFCYGCHYRRNVATARSLGDEATATAFARELMQLYLDTPVTGSASPLLSPGTTALFQKYYGLDADRFRQEKADSNKFVLERLPGIRRRIETTQDPLFTALQFAILGNYIDFSALQGELTFEKLDEMLKNAENMDLDRETYHRFREKLGKSENLLYLTDNAGEIGFDRLLGEEIVGARVWKWRLVERPPMSQRSHMANNGSRPIWACSAAWAAPGMSLAPRAAASSSSGESVYQ